MRKLILLVSLGVISVALMIACGDDDSPTGPGDGSFPKLYVLNQADQTIYILNANTLDRVDSIATPIFEPHFIEFSNDGAYYYVVGRDPGGQIAKYATANDSIVATITVQGSMFPTALVIGANNDTAYVCDFTNAAGRIHRYNITGTNFLFIDSSLQAGHQAHDIDISADGSRIVVAGFNSDELTVFQPGSPGSLTPYLLSNGTAAFGSPPATYGPYGVNIDEDNLVAVAACRKGVDQVRVMDLTTPTNIDSIVIPVGAADATSDAMVGPTLMAQIPGTDIFLVSGFVDNQLYVVNISTLTVVTTIPFATPRPFTVATNADGSRIYISCTEFRPNQGRIYVLDGSTYAKLDSTVVGSEPFGFAWRPN